VAQDTFAQLWNRVLLFAPDLPPYIAKTLVQNTQRRIVDHHYWSELKQDAEFTIRTAYTTGTVEWTKGSATITGTDTLWNTDNNIALYQEIHLRNTGNYFTITAINSDTEIEVDRTITYESSDTESYTIGDFYAELPQDLEVIEEIRDLSNEWKLTGKYYNQEYLDRIDPNRTSTGTPTLWVYASDRVDTSGNQIPRIEVWPAPTSNTEYIYRYRKTASLSSATDIALEMVPADAYLYGALMEAALWPGTNDITNHYFSVETHREMRKLFEEALNDAVVSDNDRDQRMVTYGMGEERAVPIDAKYIQSHGL
jgi:hypothetical protein